MQKDKKERIRLLVDKLPGLTPGQLYWIERVITIFDAPHEFSLLRNDFIDKNILMDFGDALRIHHSFSAEPFSKDKFEYVLEKVINMSGRAARLAPKGLRGHDITIDGVPISLKTQADKSIRKGKIWISKFMELGRGKWGDDPTDLIGLRQLFLDHIRQYARIFSLRALHRAPGWQYELVEIPMELMRAAEQGELEMKIKSKQNPKPGYCHIRGKNGDIIYQLYFDGGTERKLQLKNLLKSYCLVHATWNFVIPPE